jgi:general secretion pathway protein G
MNTHTNQQAFTLIELMVVIVIISIIGAIAYPQTLRKIAKAKQTTTQTQIEIFSAALDNYYLDNDFFPTTEQGLASLRNEPTLDPKPKNWDGPYLKKTVPLDAWGNAFIYLSPGKENPKSYDIISLGRDGQVGGKAVDHDIVSWKSIKDA